MATTLLGNLINPQVIADFIDEKLVDNMVFAPLAEVDTTLVGRPGDRLTFPVWQYIGDASVIGENESIPLVALQQNSTSVPVHKIAKGTEITDEAVLSGLGDPVGEAGMQLVLSIASAEDGEMLDVLGSIVSDMTYTASGSYVTFDDVNGALELFGEDVEGTKVLLCAPSALTQFRKADDWVPASEIGAEIVVRGAVGMVAGCQVIVSNKLKNFANGKAFIVKPGALRLIMKRDTMVETDRDIIYKKTVLTADKHFATYLYHADYAIKIA